MPDSSSRQRALSVTLICLLIAVVACGIAYHVHNQYLLKQQYSYNAMLARQAWQQSIPGMVDWLNHHPQDADMHYKLAVADMVNNSDRKEAIGQVQNALQLQPDNRRYKYLLAILFVQDGQQNEAKSIFLQLAKTKDKIGRKAQARLMQGMGNS